MPTVHIRDAEDFEAVAAAAGEWSDGMGHGMDRRPADTSGLAGRIAAAAALSPPFGLEMPEPEFECLIAGLEMITGDVFGCPSGSRAVEVLGRLRQDPPYADGSAHRRAGSLSLNFSPSVPSWMKPYLP